jgi:hypothetical protein
MVLVFPRSRILVSQLVDSSGGCHLRGRRATENTDAFAIEASAHDPVIRADRVEHGLLARCRGRLRRRGVDSANHQPGAFFQSIRLIGG